jgi:hypothetical protein
VPDGLNRHIEDRGWDWTCPSPGGDERRATWDLSGAPARSFQQRDRKSGH